MNELLTFFKDEQRRSNVRTSARIQPFCENITSIEFVMMGLECVLELLQKEM